MSKQDLMTRDEYKIYVYNLSDFIKKYSLLIPDLILIDLTLENLPEIEDKVITLKNKLGITIENVLTPDELNTFITLLNKVLKIYNKRFNLIASKLFDKKEISQIFYADFTLKKDYARKLLYINKKDFESLQKLEYASNALFINISSIADILGINQDDLQTLIDRSIGYWNENMKNKK